MACDCYMCRLMEEQDISEDEARAAMFDKINSDIASMGWSGMGIWATETSHPFTYSCGLNQQGKPDVIVVGLDPRMGHLIIQDLLKMDQPLEAGREYDRVIQGYNVRLVEATEEMRGEMTASMSVAVENGVEDFRALQIQWPDKENRLPGTPGCTVEYQTFVNMGTVN